MKARTRAEKKTTADFIRSTKLKKYLWHDRTDDTAVPDYRPVGDAVKDPPTIPRSRSFGSHSELRGNKDYGRYVPVNFAPEQLSRASQHTTPYMTGFMRRDRNPTEDNPEVREMTLSRPHRQGSVADCLGVTHHTRSRNLAAITGYTGYVPGKRSEVVFGRIYPKDNEESQAAVARRTDAGAYPEPKFLANFKPAGFEGAVQTTEDMKRHKSDANYAYNTTVHRTWAANQPQLERNTNGWRRGIRGYCGHKPYWKEEKDFFERMECGKVHPPYAPRLSYFSTLTQPTQTPRDMDKIKGSARH